MKAAQKKVGKYREEPFVWTHTDQRDGSLSALTSVLKEMFEANSTASPYATQTTGRISRKLRPALNTGSVLSAMCSKPGKGVWLLNVQVEAGRQSASRGHVTSLSDSGCRVHLYLGQLALDQSTPKSSLAVEPTPLTPGPFFLPASRWIVLALFSFPRGLYFGSIFWEDRHKGFKISLTLSIVVPNGMTFGYTLTGQM